MKVKDILNAINDFAPRTYQETWDNTGLLVGNKDMEAQGVLISLDVTEEVIDEAISKNANVIIAHHPLIFKGLKSVTGVLWTERCVIKAIKKDIAIIAAHTNIDVIKGGVSYRMAEKLGLQNIKALSTSEAKLFKISVFVPNTHLENVRNSMFEAGAGHIGNYDCCSYNTDGIGTFRANEGAKPFVGKQGEIHNEAETKIEVLVPEHLCNRIVSAMVSTHPYEEVAYDIYPLNNTNPNVGLGVIGELEKECTEHDFLTILKKTFGCKAIKHTKLSGKNISKVALCGGAGSFLLPIAIAKSADIYVSGDFKYHDFFEADSKIIIADIGHYESEQYTKEIMYEIVTRNFPNFAVQIAETVTNPAQTFV
ncbi:MAG: Nif3-like dinuclear metal center hexameric protein [Bacteroidales bacterium]